MMSAKVAPLLLQMDAVYTKLDLGPAAHVDEDLGQMEILFVPGRAVKFDQAHDLRLVEPKPFEVIRPG